ncbi:hypothetical protein [Streptomyces sp. NPDC001068]|uniref:hypothetical protein n=1 Tax=Streptomyces sp. NPDC001068 TaxID=3364544 RepID=UPI0036B6CCD5
MRLSYGLNLPHRQAAGAVCWRIDFKHAHGLELETPGFHHAVLSDVSDRPPEGDRDARLPGLALTRFRQAGPLKRRAVRPGRAFT